MTAAQELRMSRVPDDERPTSASARHRALRQGATYMRHLLGQTRQLEQEADDTPGTRDPAASRLLQASATACPNAPTDRTVIADVLAASGGHTPDPELYYAVDAAIWLTSLQGVITAIRPAADGRTAVPG
ncbi:hypothetical protein [Streptomyces mirabilis]